MATLVKLLKFFYMLSKGNVRKRHKRHGFLSRMKTKGGQKVINRRRNRKRKKLSA